MNPLPAFLIDRNSVPIAALEVAPVGGHFEGSLTLGALPPEVRRAFDFFEEIVEGQTFSLLDEAEDAITALGLRAALADGTEADLADLQVYPSTGAVSFSVPVPAPVR